MLAVSAAAEFIRCTEAARLICTCKAFNDDPGLRDRTTAGSRENELVQDAAAAAYAAVLAANNAVELLIRRPGVRHSLERWREVLAAAPVTPPLLPTNPLLFSALQDLQDAEEAHDAALELYWDAPSESTESYSEEWYGRIGVGPYARWPVRVDAIPSSHGREEDGITTFELAEAYGQL